MSIIYLRLIPDCTVIAHPLNNQFRKGYPDKFTFHEYQLNSLRTFIYKVCSPPILALPKLNLPYSPYIDSFAYGNGCTIFRT